MRRRPTSGSTITQLAVRFWHHRGTTPSKTLRAARLGLTTALAVAGLMVAFSGSAGAAVTTPLVSTSMSASGTSLSATFNEAPILAPSYSLTLADGAHAATFSSAAGTLSASVSGNTVNFSLSSAGTLTLSSLLEVIGATGINDGSGNPWNLVASGQVGKAFMLAPQDQVVVTYSEPVNVASNFSLDLQEGSGNATINQTNSHVVAGQGSATITYQLTGNPSGNVAADGPSVTGFTGVTAVPTLQNGDTLTAVLPGAAVVLSPPYGLTLSDGTDTGTLASGTNVTASETLNSPAGSTTVVYTLTGAPTLTTGAQLFTSGLHATATTGLTPAPTPPISLTTSGPLPPSPTVVGKPGVITDVSHLCSNIGVTRVFNGSNCGIGFANPGPTTPDVYDVIPLPTWDLPGPPTISRPR